VSDSRPAHQIEFIKLDGQAVRVTSWRPGNDPATFNLVTITRGSRDAELLDGLLARERIELQVGSDDAMSVTARDIDRRSVGEGQSGITRFSVILTEFNERAAPVVPERSLDERIAALEAEVEQLLNLLLHHANGVRH